LLGVTLREITRSQREVLLEVALSLRRLTGFASNGTPAYETRTETRTLRVPEGSSAALPVLIASEKETEEFRVRELLLKFRAGATRSQPPVEYGEIAVAADVPRAAMFLDGGLVGWTSSDGPIVLGTVRVGTREVTVRDASGREARTLVTVEKGRRSNVSLAILKDIPASADGLRPLGHNPQGTDEFWREKDGAIVVRIPGGEFQMGSPEGEGEPAEHPQHAVRLKSFVIDKTEVTWGQYRQFAKASGQALPKSPIWGMPEAFPVSNVSWDEARAFCAWVGGRLPTEAEWERSIRGDDSRRYPWGNDWNPWRCNTEDGGPHAPSSAGAYPDCASSYGVLDLVGSVMEWCSDWYDESYYATSPVENPTGPEHGVVRVLRGGSWMSAAFSSRAAARLGGDPAWANAMRGFRCVQDDRGIASLPLAAIAPSPAVNQPVSRLRLSVETIALGSGDAVTACETVQAKSVSAAGPVSFASWSTWGEAVPAPATKTGYDLRATSARCDSGSFPGVSRQPPGETVPFETEEIAASVGWDPGAMDPGPAQAFQVSLTVMSRNLTGFSLDGEPLYSERVTDIRSTRLEAGEEFVVPVLVANGGAREAAKVQALLLRVRAGWSGRDGAAEYGAIAVMAAAPGSPVVLDGGVAGHVGADGSALLGNVLVGQRQVRIRGASGSTVSRSLSVAKGKTAPISADEVGSGTPPPDSVVPVGQNAQGFRQYRRRRDGAIMVEIPEGEFLMGNLETENSPLPHTVFVSSYLIDEAPVTMGLFKRFAAATGRPLSPEPYWGVHDNFPVAFVRWDEARAYCEWAGGRLPTEAEREKAARGTDGRMWPWGNDPPPSPDRAVFRRAWGELGNDAVGARPLGASPYGLLDAAGNMWEWCEDWWDPDYFRASPRKDPRGPKTGRARVVKGGSWDSRPSVLSASSRNFGYTGYREGDYGFRCATDAAR